MANFFVYMELLLLLTLFGGMLTELYAQSGWNSNNTDFDAQRSSVETENMRMRTQHPAPLYSINFKVFDFLSSREYIYSSRNRDYFYTEYNNRSMQRSTTRQRDRSSYIHPTHRVSIPTYSSVYSSVYSSSASVNSTALHTPSPFTSRQKDRSSLYTSQVSIPTHSSLSTSIFVSNSSETSNVTSSSASVNSTALHTPSPFTSRQKDRSSLYTSQVSIPAHSSLSTSIFVSNSSETSNVTSSSASVNSTTLHTPSPFTSRQKDRSSLYTSQVSIPAHSSLSTSIFVSNSSETSNVTSSSASVNSTTLHTPSPFTSRQKDRSSLYTSQVSIPAHSSLSTSIFVSNSSETSNVTSSSASVNSTTLHTPSPFTSRQKDRSSLYTSQVSIPAHSSLSTSIFVSNSSETNNVTSSSASVNSTALHTPSPFTSRQKDRSSLYTSQVSIPAHSSLSTSISVSNSSKTSNVTSSSASVNSTTLHTPSPFTSRQKDRSSLYTSQVSIPAHSSLSTSIFVSNSSETSNVTSSSASVNSTTLHTPSPFTSRQKDRSSLYTSQVSIPTHSSLSTSIFVSNSSETSNVTSSSASVNSTTLHTPSPFTSRQKDRSSLYTSQVSIPAHSSLSTSIFVSNSSETSNVTSSSASVNSTTLHTPSPFTSRQKDRSSLYTSQVSIPTHSSLSTSISVSNSSETSNVTSSSASVNSTALHTPSPFTSRQKDRSSFYTSQVSIPTHSSLSTSISVSNSSKTSNVTSSSASVNSTTLHTPSPFTSRQKDRSSFYTSQVSIPTHSSLSTSISVSNSSETSNVTSSSASVNSTTLHTPSPFTSRQKDRSSFYTSQVSIPTHSSLSTSISVSNSSKTSNVTSSSASVNSTALHTPSPFTSRQKDRSSLYASQVSIPTHSSLSTSISVSNSSETNNVTSSSASVNSTTLHTPSPFTSRQKDRSSLYASQVSIPTHSSLSTSIFVSNSSKTNNVTSSSASVNSTTLHTPSPFTSRQKDRSSLYASQVSIPTHSSLSTSISVSNSSETSNVTSSSASVNSTALHTPSPFTSRQKDRSSLYASQVSIPTHSSLSTSISVSNSSETSNVTSSSASVNSTALHTPSPFTSRQKDRSSLYASQVSIPTHSSLSTSISVSNSSETNNVTSSSASVNSTALHTPSPFTSRQKDRSSLYTSQVSIPTHSSLSTSIFVSNSSETNNVTSSSASVNSTALHTPSPFTSRQKDRSSLYTSQVSIPTHSSLSTSIFVSNSSETNNVTSSSASVNSTALHTPSPFTSRQKDRSSLYASQVSIPRHSSLSTSISVSNSSETSNVTSSSASVNSTALHTPSPFTSRQKDRSSLYTSQVSIPTHSSLSTSISVSNSSETSNVTSSSASVNSTALHTPSPFTSRQKDRSSLYTSQVSIPTHSSLSTSISVSNSSETNNVTSSSASVNSTALHTPSPFTSRQKDRSSLYTSQVSIPTHSSLSTSIFVSNSSKTNNVTSSSASVNSTALHTPSPFTSRQKDRSSLYTSQVSIPTHSSLSTSIFVSNSSKTNNVTSSSASVNSTALHTPSPFTSRQKDRSSLYTSQVSIPTHSSLSTSISVSNSSETSNVTSSSASVNSTTLHTPSPFTSRQKDRSSLYASQVSIPTHSSLSTSISVSNSSETSNVTSSSASVNSTTLHTPSLFTSRQKDRSSLYTSQVSIPTHSSLSTSISVSNSSETSNVTSSSASVNSTALHTPSPFTSRQKDRSSLYTSQVSIPTHSSLSTSISVSNSSKTSNVTSSSVSVNSTTLHTPSLFTSRQKDRSSLYTSQVSIPTHSSLSTPVFVSNSSGTTNLISSSFRHTASIVSTNFPSLPFTSFYAFLPSSSSSFLISFPSSSIISPPVPSFNSSALIVGPSTLYLFQDVSLNCTLSPPLPSVSVNFTWLLNDKFYSSTQNISYTSSGTSSHQVFLCQVSFGIHSLAVTEAEHVLTIGYISSISLFFSVVQNRSDPTTTRLFCETTQTIAGSIGYVWSYIDIYNNDNLIDDSSSYIQVVDNALTISSTDPARSGVYECSATLDDVASTTKSMSTTVQIYSPPVVSLQQPSNRDVFSPIQYSRFEITCDVTGLETPTVEWLVNGLSPDPTAVTVVKNITEAIMNTQGVHTSLSHVESSLTFNSVDLSLKLITCIAINNLETVFSQSAFDVERRGIPCPPVELKKIESGSSWILLEWKLNTACGEKYLYVLSFRLEYIYSGGLRNELDVNGDSFMVNVSYLRANTLYQIRVSARNEYGTSEYTEYISVVTSPIDKKVIFYYGSENGDSEMEHGYFSQSPALKASTTIPVGSRRIESVYVSPFGILSLDKRSYSFLTTIFPHGFTEFLYLLAPFWSDIDYSVEGSISYRVYQSGKDAVHDSVIEVATQLSISHAKADTKFKALAVIVATWSEVVPFGYKTEDMARNTFQAAIVTNYEQTYTLYGYVCGEMSWSHSPVYPTLPVIGFNVGSVLSTNHHFSYQPNSHEIACRLDMNSSLAIVGYQISLNLDEVNSAEIACIRWFSNDLIVNSHLPDSSKSAFPCPCNFFQSIVDARYRYDFVARSSNTYNLNVICFVSRFSDSGNFQSSDSSSASFLSSLELTPVINSGKQRGSILSSNPVFYPDESYQEYKERDEEGYVQCCLLSDKCDLFYRRRPSQNCDGYLFRPFTWGFGDPHVISMDGFMYTFNGIGEYWYLFPVEQCDFQVQTRTQPIRDTEATVFTSIAVRISNCSTVFVSLLGRNDLSLFVDQQNRTDDIHSSGEIMDDCVNIEYFPPNGTDKPEIKIVYKNGAFLNVRANTDLISMNFSLPDSCRDRTSGLIGQWDGDVSNDLLMRNGTLLSQNVTDREKEEFADSWRITQDESFMVYEMETYTTNNPNTTPSIYLDEFIEDANVTSEIQELCNGNQICLFDAVVTNDTSVAMGTIFISEESEEAVRVGNSIPPLIQTPLLLSLSLDNLTTLEFNVTDEDDFSVNYLLSPQSVFTDILLHNLTQSLFQLQLRLIQIPDSMNMTIIANDSIGVSLVSVYVVVCHCENGGYCSDNPSDTDSVGDSGYIRSSCQCPLGYEGVYCSDIVLDPCLQSVCEVETCPAGTEKNDLSLRCEDFDECETECLELTRVCQNTYGSYICTCALGYEEAGEECIDVNECNSIISPCQHQCNNIIGSFVCECDIGYALQPDASTCKAVSNTFPCPAGYSCQDNECTNLADSIVCSYCERGTQLSSDGTYCVDLDECTLQSGICPYPSSTCVNTQPLYFCQCNQGYNTDSQGVCVDNNECISASPVCGELELCINNPGSYMCVSNCYRSSMDVLNGDICKDLMPIDNTTTTPRVPANEEVIAITYNLTLSALTSILEQNNSSLADMYTALSALLDTPLNQIDIVETVGSEGMLVLLLISTNFQVEPRFTVGLLQSSMNQHWKRYYIFVTNVVTSEINITLRGNFNTKSILIIGICISISLTILLLCIASLWMFYNTMRVRLIPQPERSVTRPKLNVLDGTRAVIQADVRIASPDGLSDNALQSNNLTLSKLASYTSPKMTYMSNSEFDLLSDTLHTYDIPPACEQKNRFTNILPPPHSRVPLFLKYGLPNSDYINANFIRGYNIVPRVYIATQAPMFSTEQDFWRMVWEQNVRTIIMLTEIIEQGREQCYPYWPDYDTIHSLVSGEVVILARSKLVKEDYQICTFILRHRGIDEVHEVSHYWYRKWPEYGVPDNPNSLVTLLLETRSEPRTSSHPVLIHCASGTGRTGVVLAVDIGMHELEEKRSVDILRNVSLLRQDRGGLIQTREQYHFLYKTICAYARYIDKQGEETD